MSIDKKDLLTAGAADLIYDEWVDNLDVPTRKVKAMRKYLVTSVKFTKKFTEWIHRFVMYLK